MGFHCFPQLQKLYILQSVMVCASMAGLLAWIPKDRWQIVASVIIGGALSAIFPAVHWLCVSTTGRQVAGIRLALTMGLGFVAVLFYTKYVPECYAPGRFDLFGNSHQIWHLIIFAVIAIYTECLVDVLAVTAMPNYCT